MIIDLLLRNGVDRMKYLFNKKLLQNNDEDIPKLSRKDIKLITHGVAIINNSLMNDDFIRSYEIPCLISNNGVEGVAILKYTKDHYSIMIVPDKTKPANVYYMETFSNDGIDLNFLHVYEFIKYSMNVNIDMVARLMRIEVYNNMTMWRIMKNLSVEAINHFNGYIRFHLGGFNNSNDVDLENESEKISAVYEILPGKQCHYMLMTPREMINLFNNK